MIHIDKVTFTLTQTSNTATFMLPMPLFKFHAICNQFTHVQTPMIFNTFSICHSKRYYSEETLLIKLYGISRTLTMCVNNTSFQLSANAGTKQNYEIYCCMKLAET